MKLAGPLNVPPMSQATEMTRCNFVYDIKLVFKLGNGHFFVFSDTVDTLIQGPLGDSELVSCRAKENTTKLLSN